MVARIIVIDNDDQMLDLFTSCLNSAGWEVFGYDYAHFRQFGLSPLRQLQPDLLILDFNIRDDGIGWEFLQMLKMEDKTAHIPILISTTPLHLSAEIRDFLIAQYIHVVYKPINLDKLLQLVQHTLILAVQRDILYSSNLSLPILVVEDTQDLREALATILKLEGYQVVTVENGLLALDAIYNTDHCLILLDIAMPIMDGIEFLRIYDRQLRPHIPIVILSARDSIQTRDLPTFVIDVLPKPFVISQLLQTVQKYAQPS